MRIAEEDVENIYVISVSGRIDSNTSKDLEDVLIKAIDNNYMIVVDLADAEYISSLGLRVLLASLRMLKTKKGDMRLTSLQPVVLEIFEISGLSKIFSIHSDLKDAIDDLRPNLRI